MASEDRIRRSDIRHLPTPIQRDVVLGRICRVTWADGPVSSVVQRSAEMLQTFFDAYSIGIWFIEGDRLLLEGIAFAEGVAAEAAEQIRRLTADVPLESDLPGPLAIRAGTPLWMATENAELDPDLRRAVGAIGATRLIALPITFEDEALGCAILASAGPQPFEPVEEQLMAAALRQLGMVVHRERLGERDRELSGRLEHLAAAIENLPHPVKFLSPDWRITSVNPAVERVFGYAPDELIGESIWKIRGTPEGAALQPEIEKALESGGWRGDTLDRHKDGRLIPTYLTVVPVRDAAGSITAILEIERDLSREKEHEQKMLHSYRLAAIGELAAGVAHEVNNPLGAISNYAQLLEMEPLPAEVLSDLQAIRSEATRAGNIIRNLLAFARQSVPERRRVDLREAVQGILTLRRQVLQLANIEVEMEVDPETPKIWADPQNIQQVLHNLLVNARQAIQHSYGSGTIRVRIRRTGGEMVEVSVEDTGPGVDPRLMERIFSPFYTTKDIGEGTGLGLSVSRGIVLEHGGELRVENWGRPPVEGGAPGEGGARFSVLLPVASEDAEPAGSAAPSAPEPRPEVGGEPGRVLIVEDEPAVAASVHKFLSRAGYEAVVAMRAEEALERIDAGEAFDAVITDLKMPGLGGERFYDRLADSWPEIRERLIFTSGDVVSPATHEFLAASGRPVLPKPYALTELRALVEDVIAGR